MHHRKQTKVLLVLIFFTIALLSYTALWAQDCPETPSFTETIIDGNTKVVSSCDGESIQVFFWDENCTATDPPDICWVEAPPQQGVICICKGAGCSDDLRANIEGDSDPAPYEGEGTPDIDVQCYTINQAGAGTTGCLVSKNPRTYLYGGDAYTR